MDYKYLWLLQPTSPFRENLEFLTIDQVVSTLTKSNTEWSSIVSFKSTNGYHPDRMVKKIGDYVVPIIDQTNGDNVPRQALDTVYIKDGGFYVLKKENLDKKIMLGDRIIPFMREGLKTINIDSLDELKKAQESEEAKRGYNR
jgi:CMP-N-acetylneuraminic acid synthetase